MTKVDRAVKVIGGLKALFGPREKVWVEGKVWRRDDLIALFASHTAAIRDKNARYLAYLASVAAEKALARQTNAVWLALRNTVSTAHGPAAIVKVGLQPYKKPGPKTIASKLAGVQKRAARKRPT